MTSSLDTFLAVRSGLTAPQIETANLQQRVQKGEISVKIAASTRTPEGVTEGAYFRVLSQAKVNVEEAIFTLLLSHRRGYVKLDDFRRLLDLLSTTPSDLDQADYEKVTSLVDVLVKRIVML